MATGSDIAKAGWLYRLSSVLHRWKRNWFVLYRDGDLKYFESPDNPRAEERIVVRAWVSAIKTGPDCRRVEPPEGYSNVKNCFLELMMTNKESMILCAESFDDMRAWQIALEEARIMPGVPRNAPPVYMPPPGVTTYASPYYGVTQYPGYTYPPGQTTVIHGPSGSSTTTTILAPPAQQVVYMDDYPHRYRYHRGGIFGRPLYWW